MDDDFDQPNPALGLDTHDWTLEDHLNWIRTYAEAARLANSMWLQWQLDILGLHAGTVEVVEWPKRDESRRLRRGNIPADPKPQGTRMVFPQDGTVFLVRDV